MVDLHALTLEHDPAALSEATMRLATLLLDGPLAWLSDQDRQGAIQRTLDVVMRGIAAPAAG